MWRSKRSSVKWYSSYIPNMLTKFLQILWGQFSKGHCLIFHLNHSTIPKFVILLLICSQILVPRLTSYSTPNKIVQFMCKVSFHQFLNCNQELPQMQKHYLRIILILSFSTAKYWIFFSWIINFFSRFLKLEILSSYTFCKALSCSL